MKVRPAGSRSLTTTPVAVLGPLLVALIVKVTLLFRLGTLLSTVFVTAMSAATGVIVTLAESSAGVLSDSFSAVLVAVFVVGDVVLTIAVIPKVALALGASPPTVQSPVVWS